MRIKRIISIVLIIALTGSLCLLSGCGQDGVKDIRYKVDPSKLLYENNVASYSYYLEQNKNANFTENAIDLSPDNVTNAFSDEYALTIDGKKFALMDENSRWLEWKVSVKTDTRFVLWADYRTVSGDNTDMILSLQMDGSFPYQDLQNLTLPRLWEDVCGEEFDTDNKGNDIKPVKKEVIADLSTAFFDNRGYHAEPYELCISAGEHTLRLTDIRGAVLLRKFVLKPSLTPPDYKTYLSAHDENGSAATPIVLEAEHPKYTTDSAIYAVSDWQDPTTTPNSADYVRLNTIGDTNWRQIGQKIIWEFEAKQTGFYALSIRARQDYSEGMNAYRALYLDGDIPFKEAASIAFPYDFDWKTTTVGKDSPYYFFLEKGKHTLELAVAPGKSADILRDLDTVLSNLNAIYRKIIIITGTTVDVYQDYDLENKIPELINSFKDCRNKLYDLSKQIKSRNGNSGSRSWVLDATTVLLDGFIEHPYGITGGLSSYKTKIEDIASLLTNMSEQALLLDKITFTPKGKTLPKNVVSFLDRAGFKTGKFINSYRENDETGSKGKNINVWVSTGRDQAQIIRQMINNDFVQKTGIGVKLNIVDTGSTLIQAALAGKGPDVAINIAHDTPVNLAMRGGLINLKPYIEKAGVYGDFYESSWMPFRYENGIYGVPETQVFDMLFVRNDIMAELGIRKAPDTWDEFYQCMKVIQNNNLMIGLSETNAASVAVSGGIGTFQKFYFQQGNTFYNDDHSKTTFDTEEAIECMSRVCELYTKYGLDRQFDFLNRFRSGELVMGISGYSTYNLLVASAPEINGLWSMFPIPGTRRADGSISRAEASTGTASIILKAAKDHDLVEESWEFVEWWTGAKTQAEYAQRLEGVMGVAARYTPANIHAFGTIRWSSAESEAIMNQWKEVYNVREIPGNYYIARSLTSAIRNTITKGTSIRFNLTKYNNDINAEITRKRKEFSVK